MRRPAAIATEIILVLGGLTIAAIAVTYPLIRHLTTRLPNDLTDPVLVAWVMAWDADAFRHGITTLFNAPSFFPYLNTLVYSETMIGVAIFTAPLQWLTANPVLVYNVAFIGSFVQAGAGMYVLARALTKRPDAAMLAALAYAFAPMRVAQFAHLQWLMTGWLPLSLWALHRYFETTALRYLLACAAAYVLQGLTSSYFTYFSLVPLMAVAIADAWRFRPPIARLLAHGAAAAVLCAVALSPLIAAYARARQAHDFKRPAFEIVQLSADVSDYLHAHNHVKLWARGPWANGEHEVFPGVVVLLLAAIAWFTSRRAPGSRVRVYAGIAVAVFLLSLGPSPAAWGHHAPIPGPYQLLLDIVPGLDGLRALSRIAVIVVLALAVMAAYGAAWLLARVQPQRRWMVAALLGGAIVAEGNAAPIRTLRFDPLGDADDRRAYAFLKDRGPHGAVLELPMSLVDEEREQRYQYLTLFHGHRIVNGRSGYVPALTQWLYSEDQSPLSDRQHLDIGLEFLSEIGVRYVVLHQNALRTTADETAWQQEIAAARPPVAAENRFGDTVVLTLADAVALPHESNRRPIPAAEIHPRASLGADRLPLLFDGDRDSRWLTGGPQTGSEWIELAFDTPRHVTAVQMQTAERSFGDYPRELAIDVVEDAGTRTVFRGSVLPAFGRGLAADLRYPWIDILLPENQARAIRLRQLGRTDQLFWSIHELQLEERTR